MEAAEFRPLFLANFHPAPLPGDLDWAHGWREPTDAFLEARAVLTPRGVQVAQSGSRPPPAANSAGGLEFPHSVAASITPRGLHEQGGNPSLSLSASLSASLSVGSNPAGVSDAVAPSAASQRPPPAASPAAARQDATGAAAGGAASATSRGSAQPLARPPAGDHPYTLSPRDPSISSASKASARDAPANCSTPATASDASFVVPAGGSMSRLASPGLNNGGPAAKGWSSPAAPAPSPSLLQPPSTTMPNSRQGGGGGCGGSLTVTPLPSSTSGGCSGSAGQPPRKASVGRSHAAPGDRGTSLSEIDSRMASNLDRFFSDDNNWKQVAHEVANTAKVRPTSMDFIHTGTTVAKARFKVQVPKPYPGVQYRKSKNLEERYPRYAKQGSIVTGQVEDHGEWLRINDQVFLPMKVGTVRILEPLPPEDASRSDMEGGSRSARWWNCGPSPQGEAAPTSTEPEVVVPEDLTGSLPWEGSAGAGDSGSVAGPEDEGASAAALAPHQSSASSAALVVGSPGAVLPHAAHGAATPVGSSGSLAVENLVVAGEGVSARFAGADAAGGGGAVGGSTAAVSGNPAPPVGRSMTVPRSMSEGGAILGNRGGSPHSLASRRSFADEAVGNDASRQSARFASVPHLQGPVLSNVEEADRFVSDAINPFSDTPRGGNSPAESPLRLRTVSMT